MGALIWWSQGADLRDACVKHLYPRGHAKRGPIEDRVATETQARGMTGRDGMGKAISDPGQQQNPMPIQSTATVFSRLLRT